MHALCNQWFPSIPAWLPPKKLNGLFFRCLRSVYKNSMDSSLFFFKASAYSHSLITCPFYTQEKIFQGKGHLLKKLPPVRYVCSACCNGHTVRFKSTSNGCLKNMHLWLGGRCKLFSCYFCFLAFWNNLCPLSLSMPYFDHNIIVLKKVTRKCISLSNSHSELVKTFQIFFVPCLFSLNRMEVSNIEQTKIQILFIHFETP